MAEVPGCAGGQEAARSPAPGGEKSLEPAEGVGRQLRAPSAPRLRFILDGREKAGDAARGRARHSRRSRHYPLLSAQLMTPGTCRHAPSSPARRWLGGGLGPGSSRHLAEQEYPQDPRGRPPPGSLSPLPRYTGGAAMLPGLSCASGEGEEKHPACFEAAQGTERSSGSGWEGHRRGRTTLRFVLSPLAS